MCMLRSWKNNFWYLLIWLKKTCYCFQWAAVPDSACALLPPWGSEWDGLWTIPNSESYGHVDLSWFVWHPGSQNPSKTPWIIMDHHHVQPKNCQNWGSNSTSSDPGMGQTWVKDLQVLNFAHGCTNLGQDGALNADFFGFHCGGKHPNPLVSYDCPTVPNNRCTWIQCGFGSVRFRFLVTIGPVRFMFGFGSCGSWSISVRLGFFCLEHSALIFCFFLRRRKSKYRLLPASGFIIASRKWFHEQRLSKSGESWNCQCRQFIMKKPIFAFFIELQRQLQLFQSVYWGSVRRFRFLWFGFAHGSSGSRFLYCS